MLRVERGRLDADSGGMMQIDAHQHFWRYDAAEYGWIDDAMVALRRDFLPAESAAEMAAAGVGACIAVQVRQTLEETRWLLALADAHPSIAGVVGWVDLQAGADRVRSQLETFAPHPKFVGVRHIVQAEPDDRFLVRPQVLEGLAVLDEFGLAFDLLVYRHQLPAAIDCVGRLPHQRFVLDHLAKPDIRGGGIDAWERDIRRLAACPNVFAKVSGLITEADWRSWTPEQIRPYLDVAFDAFGVDRLIAGSDWPVCLVAGSYRRTMDVVRDYIAPRPAHEQDAILGGNAQDFWRLKDHDAHDARGDRAAAVRGRV
ncbi:MAG TPA: amidohydrolase family protein [Vicinamibacterales bacterium]|nr:amidohydrolase family protein [Vicinamibacterales bacterium]